jgi:hypothetical protein
MSTITFVSGAALVLLCAGAAGCAGAGGATGAAGAAVSADGAGAAGAVLAPASARATPLFNGRDFAGFELVTVPASPLVASFVMRDDGVIASTGQPTGYLATTASYENFRLHVEWRWSGKPGNAGVLLHIQGGPKDRAWPLSLQVQTKNGNVGDVLPMAGASFAEPLTSAPGAATPIKGFTGTNSERPVGEWNSADIVSRDGTLAVSINGIAQNRVSGATPHAGKIGFQLEGTPFDMRKVTIERLP